MIEQRVTELSKQRVPFVRARVVLADRPTSAKPGDQAIVLPDGTIEGFVGGACAESTVRAQSLALLDSGDTLLLRITPTLESPVDHSADGRLTVHNPCLSGGTLEIFLEPVRPAPLLLIVGDTPIARSLDSLARAMGYDIVQYEANSESSAMLNATAVVVASHGRDEEDVLRLALSNNVEYVGLVASRKRGEAVLASLGMCSSHTSRVRTPAGIDIGARTPQEIALSILSEIVSVRPRPTGRPVTESAGTIAMALDPVCSMTVAKIDSSLHLDHGGERFWFCGSGCLRAFAAAPSSYLTTSEPVSPDAGCSPRDSV